MGPSRIKIKVHKYEAANVHHVSRPLSRTAGANISFDAERCKGCGLCVDACPLSNLRLSEKMNRKGYRYVEIIEPDKCTGCGVCFQMCPDLAIEIEKK